MGKQAIFGATLAAALLGLVGDARATPASDRARELGGEGFALFDAGDYAHALEKFRAAKALYDAPSLSLAIARSLRRLGRLQEAKAAYEDAARASLSPDASQTLRDAREAAIREGAQLAARVPTLTVVAEGADAITVDGLAWPVNLPRAIDPGDHKVVARRGALERRVDAHVAEGDAARTSVEFPTPEAGGGSRLPAWIAFGVGGAGLVVGGVFTGVAASDRSALDGNSCVNGLCPRALQGDVDGYNTARVGATVGFVAGAAGVAAGVVWLLVAPRPTRGAVGFSLEPTASGVAGRF